MKKGKIVGYIIINHSLHFPEARDESGISRPNKYAELYQTRKSAKSAMKEMFKYSDEIGAHWRSHDMGIYPVRKAAK